MLSVVMLIGVRRYDEVKCGTVDGWRKERRFGVRESPKPSANDSRWSRAADKGDVDSAVVALSPFSVLFVFFRSMFVMTSSPRSCVNVSANCHIFDRVRNGGRNRACE